MILAYGRLRQENVSFEITNEDSTLERKKAYLGFVVVENGYFCVFIVYLGDRTPDGLWPNIYTFFHLLIKYKKTFIHFIWTCIYTGLLPEECGVRSVEEPLGARCAFFVKGAELFIKSKELW